MFWKGSSWWCTVLKVTVFMLLCQMFILNHSESKYWSGAVAWFIMCFILSILNVFVIHIDPSSVSSPCLVPPCSLHERISKSAPAWYYVGPRFFLLALFIFGPISGETNMQWNKAPLWLCSSQCCWQGTLTQLHSSSNVLWCEHLKRTNIKSLKDVKRVELVWFFICCTNLSLVCIYLAVTVFYPQQSQ